MAVAAFLDGELPFLGIPQLNEATLDAMPAVTAGNLDDIVAADAAARQLARRMVEARRFG